MARETPESLDIHTLVSAVAERRDQRAFALLFDHFAPRVKAYLIRAGCSHGEAEDLTQDVMTVLWRKAAMFDVTKASLATWLYRVARNRRIDALRRGRAARRDGAEMAMADVGGIDDPEGQIDLQAIEARVRVLLDALPEEQKTLVRLAFFDGLSHSDVAAKTNLPLGTVKSRIRLGFAKLRRDLETAGVAAAQTLRGDRE